MKYCKTDFDEEEKIVLIVTKHNSKYVKIDMVKDMDLLCRVVLQSLNWNYNYAGWYDLVKPGCKRLEVV